MPDIIEDTTEPLAPPADAGPSRKHGKKASRSRSRKAIHEESEDDDQQADEEHQKLEEKPRASTRSLSRSVSRKKGPSSRKKKTVPPVSEEDKEEPDDATPTGSTDTRSRSRKSTKSTVTRQSDTDEDETKHSALIKSQKSSSRTGSRSKVASLEGYAIAPEKMPEEDSDDRHEGEEKLSSRMDMKYKNSENAPVIKVNKVEEQQVSELSKARKASISSKRSTTVVEEESKTTTEMVGGGNSNEQETLMFMNSEDEIEADLEDVQLDDTETDDRVAEEPPQGQGVIDEISFAPRLVTKAFSEVEQEQQQQRPRTPNLVPFMGMARTVSPSHGRLYLGANAAGPEEQMSEVEKKIPKTPPRKIIVTEGGPVPSARSTNNLTTNPGVGVAEVEHPALQPKSEQVEEKRHHHRTPQRGQEALKTQQQPVEPQFVPFLSKLPFVPLHVLTEAELDMTVEDWIRYQMEVEYDKFKRDGERELMRFRKKAEETRRVIEEL